MDSEFGSTSGKLNVLNRKMSNVEERRLRSPRIFKRQQSLIVFEDLILCELCHNKLKDHRMLLCQHTFCQECLNSYYTTSNINDQKDEVRQIPENRIFIPNKKVGINSNVEMMKCPICFNETPLKNGHMSIPELPKNMQVEKLLRIVDAQNNSTSMLTYRCAKCQTVGCEAGQSCLHCMKDFCNICWCQHQLELKKNLNNLLQQLDDCDAHLRHKTELLETRLEQLVNFIESTTISKIEEIKEMEQLALDDLKSLKYQEEEEKTNISGRIEELKENINRNLNSYDGDKVTLYINFHKKTSKVFEDIQHFGIESIHFNQDTFKLEKEENASAAFNLTSKSFAYSRSKYKMKSSSKPKLVWEKCPRPGHVAIPPWDNKKLYIAATDSRTILVMSIDKLKLLEKISSPEMLYPQSLAFAFDTEEIFVSDKWKHSIHVFSKTGGYIRSFGGKGSGPGKLNNPNGITIGRKNQLFVCDTGNDRIAIFDTKSGQFLSTFGIVSGNLILNQPEDIAIRGEQIIVADTGNHSIKFFNFEGIFLEEFGSFGNGKRQFKSPEVLEVDTNENILVGDSGNARIQIFEPAGTLVKILGGTYNRFNSISGICVSADFDIIVTDNKSRCLTII
ncbi:hypothetical protein HHI36_002293 [Cryptolaemus montrouzieri]|uniref:RING-type domain-containing protein n=1 Tax=Cryptolaemus montrouzieri TaxID=559131 RepID=A0ABD2PAC8_9CUCU